MRNLPSATVLSLLLGATAFAQNPQTPPNHTPADTKPPVAETADAAQEPQKAAPKKLDEAKYDHFGTGITEGTNVPVLEAMKDPAKYTGKTIRLEGTVNEICQVKGCWMYLGEASKPVMVKFKDYAFFMPKDGAGRTAIVEGTMAMKQETVEQTKHYLEDAGKHEEAAKVTEGRRIYTFMAAGVALQKKAN
jgi:hypothetical protein